MRELRQLSAQRTEQQHVLGRVGEVILTTDDVADAHGDVIHDHHEVVQRRTVGAGDDQIASQLARVDADVTPHEIVELDRASADAEADDRGAPFGTASLALLRREVGAAAAIAGSRGLSAAVRLALLGRAEAGIGLVLGQQPPDGLGVAVATL